MMLWFGWQNWPQKEAEVGGSRNRPSQDLMLCQSSWAFFASTSKSDGSSRDVLVMIGRPALAKEFYLRWHENEACCGKRGSTKSWNTVTHPGRRLQRQIKKIPVIKNALTKVLATETLSTITTHVSSIDSRLENQLFDETEVSASASRGSELHPTQKFRVWSINLKMSEKRFRALKRHLIRRHKNPQEEGWTGENALVGLGISWSFIADSRLIWYSTWLDSSLLRCIPRLVSSSHRACQTSGSS